MAKDEDREGAGWGDIDAGWDLEGVAPAAPRPAATTDTTNLPVAAEEPGEFDFEEEAVTSQVLTDSSRIHVQDQDQGGPQISIQPLTDEAELETLEEPEVALEVDSDGENDKETVRRLRAISTATESRLLLEARAARGAPDEQTARSPGQASDPDQAIPAGPGTEPSGSAFTIPSPLQPAAPPAARQGIAAHPAAQGSSLVLLVFILLMILALGSVGAVIWVAFF